MRHRRGNPNWGRAMPFALALPTEFELTAKRLRLTPQMYASSRELKRWCESNRNRCYVPEWLLKEWNLQVELYYGPEAAQQFLNWIVDVPGSLVSRIFPIDLHEGDGVFGFFFAIFLSWLWTSTAIWFVLLGIQRIRRRPRGAQDLIAGFLTETTDAV